MFYLQDLLLHVIGFG
ncbi:hypothetical protein [Izhakiella capsodis]